MALNAAGCAMNPGKHILFLVIEGNQGNRGDIQNKYGKNEVCLRYEDEAIKCVAAWKKFGIDIPIYVLCVNNNTPSEGTIQKLREMGCEYFHWPQEEADNYKCGYWNVPLAGYLLEGKIPSDMNIIHVDLDMTLFRPLGTQ
jgi:hypothetical protein